MNASQRINEIKQSVTEIETHLSKEDFQDYCDAAYTCITYLRTVKQ